MGNCHKTYVIRNTPLLPEQKHHRPSGRIRNIEVDIVRNAPGSFHDIIICLPDEIIVADDGSKRDTGELIRKIAGESPVEVLHLWQEDKGFRPGWIRNKSIARCKGEYIILIDGDVILHNKFLVDHKNLAKRNMFTQGSRVLLTQPKTVQVLREQKIGFTPFESGLNNRHNAIYSLTLARILSGKRQSLKGVRSCNFAFWKSDGISVNGFNEDFVGWGREDSEFAARLMHNGVGRQNIKFRGIMYHLYHPMQSRNSLPENDKLLENTIMNKLTWCSNGIDKYFT